MRLFRGFEFLLLALFAFPAFGDVVVTRYNLAKDRELVTFAFTADAAGAASIAVGMAGRVVKVITNPGTPAPTANYDVYFYDAEDTALSLTTTILENRHTTTTEQVYPLLAGSTGTVSSVPPLALGTYTFTVANAGSGGQGRVLVYLEK